MVLKNTDTKITLLTGGEDQDYKQQVSNGENYPKLTTKIKSQIQAVLQISSRTNTKQHNIAQLLKTKDEEENLQSGQKKRKKITTEGTIIRLMTDFPVETIEARRQ